MTMRRLILARTKAASVPFRVAAALATAASIFTSTLGAPAPAYALTPAVDAVVQVVGGHDEFGRAVPWGSAPYVDVEVYLFERGTRNPVACGFENQVSLHWSQNYVSNDLGIAASIDAAPTSYRDGLARTATGQRELRELDGKSIPAWTFANLAVYPPPFRVLAHRSKTYFWVDVAGADVRTNVAPYAVDPRTVNSDLDSPPETVGGPAPAAIEARIQVVTPHDDNGAPAPVTSANLVDIGVDLAAYPGQASWGWSSVGFGFDRPVRLLRSVDDGFLEVVKSADDVQTVTYQFPDGTKTSWPRWIFNNVDVSDATNAAVHYYFAVQIDGIETYPAIWGYGAASPSQSNVKAVSTIVRSPPAQSCRAGGATTDQSGPRNEMEGF